MAIVSFGLGLIALMVAAAAITIGGITYRRYRRPWQLLYLICAVSWIVDLGSYYLGWVAFSVSESALQAAQMLTWSSIALLPINLVVMPLWLLQLAGRPVRRPMVTGLVGNLVVALALVFFLLQRFTHEGVEVRPVDSVVGIVLLLQFYGVALGSLVYALIVLRDRSIPAPRRDFRFVVVIIIIALVFDYVAELLGLGDIEGYGARIELPFFALVGFGYIGVRQARRLIDAGSDGGGGSVVVDHTFFAEYGLSPREQEIAPALRSNEKTRAIAQRLFISEATLNSHIRSIYRKCGVHSRVALIDLMRRYERPAATIPSRRSRPTPQYPT